jgi:PAS domain-containing protein
LSKNPDSVNDAFIRAVFEEDIPDIVNEWKALAQGEPRTFQLKFQNRNHGLAACVPIKAADGTVTGVHGILTNITALRHMNATEERFDRFLQIVPSGILITDSIGGVIFVNDGWFDRKHLSTDSLGGHPY